MPVKLYDTFSRTVKTLVKPSNRPFTFIAVDPLSMAQRILEISEPS